MDKIKMRFFKIGVDPIPWWFKNKIKDGTVEYTYEKAEITGCRYYDVRGKERLIPTGGIVYADSLYKEEPKRN